MFRRQTKWQPSVAFFGICVVVGMLHTSCSECVYRPLRHEQCAWEPANFRAITGVCGLVEIEGMEFQRNGGCNFVVCIESDSAEECADGDSPLGDFTDRVVSRMSVLSAEKNLGFRYSIEIVSYDTECEHQKPVDGKCCVVASFVEIPPADIGGQCE
jgi:hypothetical protein